MKEEILKRLALAGKNITSGVQLSSELGISRVAVWKNIKKLNQEGYDIISSSKGYRLKNSSDLLAPFCFDGQKYDIHFFPRLSSTMDTAKKMAEHNAKHLSVVIAEEQTNGRGRLNRAWLSSKGGLWLTIILKPDLPPALSFKVNFAASLCLVKTLTKLFKIDASVKWPNDIIANGKKLAGLLSEMETRGDMISFVNIGIGLNVNNSPKKDEPNAISIRNILHRKVLRKKILSSFLESFELKLYEIYEEDNNNIIDQWKRCTSTIGRQVSIETFGRIYRGTAIDIDESGALILRQKDGTKKRIIYGDCFHN